MCGNVFQSHTCEIPPHLLAISSGHNTQQREESPHRPDSLDLGSAFIAARCCVSAALSLCLSFLCSFCFSFHRSILQSIFCSPPGAAPSSFVHAISFSRLFHLRFVFHFLPCVQSFVQVTVTSITKPFSFSPPQVKDVLLFHPSVGMRRN